MMKKLLLTFCLCLFIFTSGAQTLYTFNGKCRIKLPAKLELQYSDLNFIKRIDKQKDVPQVNITTQSERIVFQQKGLDAGERQAFDKYCRVIVEYFKQNRNEPTYGRGDPIIVDRNVLRLVNEAAEENCRISGTPLMRIISTESMTINGFPVLYYSYRRMGWLKDDGRRQPPVIVNVYTIFNRYEFVKLTFSYREAERERWKSIHGNIINTFSFDKKY